jgi:hypothetical protein
MVHDPRISGEEFHGPYPAPVDLQWDGEDKVAIDVMMMRCREPEGRLHGNDEIWFAENPS